MRMKDAMERIHDRFLKRERIPVYAAVMLILTLSACAVNPDKTEEAGESISSNIIELQAVSENSILVEGKVPSIEAQVEFLAREPLSAGIIECLSYHGDLYGITKDEEAVLLSSNHNEGAGPKRSVTIPKQVGGYPVTGIEESAGNETRDIMVIKMPPTVRVVEDYAFSECEWLCSVDSTDGLQYIGKGNFRDTVKISAWELQIAEENEDGFVIVNGNLLACDSEAKGLTIPEGVEVISMYAFEGSPATTLILPESIKEIYSLPDNLVKMNIPEGLRRLELKPAFYGGYVYDGRKTPWFQNKIRQAEDGMVIINGMLLYCGIGVKEVTVPEGVWSIGNAFTNNEVIEKVILPESVKEIGSGAFWRCTALQEVNFPEGLMRIGEHAFSGCESLKEIRIGSQIKMIGNRAFSLCYSLQHVELPKEIKVIPSGCFSYCMNLTEISIPKGVAAIGDYAFSGCEKLSDMLLPDTVQYIGSSAFRECSALEALSIPESIDYIGFAAFGECVQLQQIVFEGNIPYIYAEVFELTDACEEEVVIELPEKVPERLFEHSYTKTEEEWLMEMFGLPLRSSVTFVVHSNSPAEEMIKNYQFKDGKEMYQYRYYDE